MRFSRRAAVAVLLLAACGEPAVDRPDDGEPPNAHLLVGLPVPASAVKLETRGTRTSAEAVMVAETMTPDSVADFYRRALLALDWQIESDARLPDGGLSLHARHGQRPIWVLIYPHDPAGTRFSVITGAPDSLRL